MPSPSGSLSSAFVRLFTFTALGAVGLLSGCASSSNPGPGNLGTTTTTITTSGTLATGGAANVYALDDTYPNTTIANDVLAFPAASSGTSTVPNVTLTLNTLAPTGAAFDGAGLLYVAGEDDVTGIPSVNVYAAGAATGATPIRTITPNATFDPVSVAVSSAGQVYVLEGAYDANGNPLATQIEVFAPGASAGNTPSTVITGTATQMIDPADIAVDSSGKIYVANYQDNNVSQVLVFAASASGNIAPTQTITFNNEITGIAVDSSANIYVSEVSSAGDAGIAVYAAGATGSATPTKTISGSSTGLDAADTGAVRVDAAGNIWIIQQSPDTSEDPLTYLEAWAPSASGNVAPAVSFSPPSLLNPNGAFAIR